ncbi:hypothetical protein RND81_07G017200 [Saponaria officinalis]|uniref:Uncharacterized protein n=1 Tax=Saponaria officinalis TaxID=3572 RepID=A0AAW1JPI8_SAPOF
MAITRKSRVSSARCSDPKHGGSHSKQGSINLGDFLPPQFGEKEVPAPVAAPVDEHSVLESGIPKPSSENVWKNKGGGGFKEKQGLELEFIESDDDLVHIELYEVVSKIDYWANTLVGFVLGEIPM